MKLKGEPSFNTLIEEDYNVVIELMSLACNIREKMCNALDSFLSFMKRYGKKKTHNMLTLMLDPRFKSLHLVSSFIDCEHGEVIVENYDINFVFYATLIELTINLLTKKWIIGFFEIVARTCEPTKETLVKKKLFQCFQMDVTRIKCLLRWWEKHGAIFFTIAFLAFEILHIIGSQMETKRISSLLNILTNLRRQKI